MSYCLNPACPNPENLTHTERCQACGSKLLLRDRYRVIQALGQGGFGATFLAHDESLPGQPYRVIKQLRPTATAPHILDMARDLFRREAKTLGKIGNHPQLPQLLDYFEAKQEFYLVQEYISGLTLQQEVKRSGPFSEAGVKQFLSEVLPLVQYIHSQQVIHRDIKPANLIRRTQDCRLVLIDFGAVKDQVSQTAMGGSEQTALTSYAIGTPGYAPPEQMAMRPVYASDVYALGITCIYLLTGKSPKDLDYDPATGEMIWLNQVHVSDHFAGVLKKMLEVSVRHRYQSANEILRALDLEPYLDSLAQGMVSQGNNAPRNDNHQNSTDLSRSADLSRGLATSPSSPSARMAMAIRARQGKLPDSTHLQTGGTRNPIFTAKPATSVTTIRSNGSVTPPAKTAATPKPSIPQKLDAEGVQTAYVKGRRDFASHDLSLLVLQRIDLSNANFHEAKLHKTNFQGTTLYNTNFSRASLTRAILRDANLGRAYLSHADLEGADLRGADLSYAYLSNANLRGANLCGADLTGAKVTEEQLALARTNWMTTLPNGKRGFW